MVFSHHGGAGETFVFIKTGIFSRKIHLINRFSEYLIILNFSFWWIWSLKKLKCLFDFQKAQDKIRRQRKRSNQPQHVFTIQPARCQYDGSYLVREVTKEIFSDIFPGRRVGATSISSTSSLLNGCGDTREFLNSSVYCTNIIRVAFWTETRCAKTLKIVRPFPEKWRRRENVNLKDENERESAN